MQVSVQAFREEGVERRGRTGAVRAIFVARDRSRHETRILAKSGSVSEARP